MSQAHIVELPNSVFVLKIVQLVISVLVLGLDAYLTVEIQGLAADVDFTLFVPLFSILIIIYYFVAVKGVTAMYNWVVLLIVECLAVIFWLSSWAALTADYVVFDEEVCSDGYNCAVANDEIASSSILTAFFAIWKVVIILGAINFVLYCVTLGFMGTGIHRHRMAGKPITANGSYTPTARGVSDLEENKMHMAPAPAYPNDVQYAPMQEPRAPEVYGSRPY